MRYDVAVIGLGPAGITFLKCIENSGLKVIAFDSSSFPRKKLCAGGLTRKAYLFLKRKFEGIDSVVKFKAFDISLFEGDREVLVTSRSPFIYMTDRKELDNFLFESVADRNCVHTPEKVLSIEKDENFWRVKTDKDSYTSRVVISSDGVNSRIARQLNIEREIGVTYEADIEVVSSRTVVDFSGFSWGYFWIFPKGDFVTAGFGELRRGKLYNVVDKFKSFLLKHGIKREQFIGSGFPIPAGKSFNKIYRDNVLFLGDAGGLVDPLTGEGIYYAARSGEVAAEIVTESFETGDFSSLRNYEVKVNREFGRQFKWARISGAIFFRTKGLAFKFLERDKSLREIVGEVLSGNASYRESFFEFAKRSFKSIVRF